MKSIREIYKTGKGPSVLPYHGAGACRELF